VKKYLIIIFDDFREIFVGYLEYPGILRYSMGIPWYVIQIRAVFEKYLYI